VSNQPNLWNFHSSNFWFCSYFFFSVQDKHR